MKARDLASDLKAYVYGLAFDAVEAWGDDVQRGKLRAYARRAGLPEPEFPEDECRCGHRRFWHYSHCHYDTTHRADDDVHEEVPACRPTPDTPPHCGGCVAFVLAEAER